MRRLLYLFGLLVGSFFGLLAVNLMQSTFTVTTQTDVPNPSCQVPIVGGLFCSLTGQSSTTRINAGFTSAGLGLFVIEASLFLFAIIATLGALVLIWRGKPETMRAWAITVIGMMLGFLVTFSFGFAYVMWSNYNVFVFLCGVFSLGDCNGQFPTYFIGQILPYLLAGIAVSYVAYRAYRATGRATDG